MPEPFDPTNLHAGNIPEGLMDAIAILVGKESLHSIQAQRQRIAAATEQKALVAELTKQAAEAGFASPQQLRNNKLNSQMIDSLRDTDRKMALRRDLIANLTQQVKPQPSSRLQFMFEEQGMP